MKSRLKRFFETYGYLSVAFLLPLILMFLIYAAMEVFPFGENSVLVLDLNGQYVYFFQGLRDIILKGGSLLYSWSRALGGEFLGMFAYYLSSPFSILVALFPEDMITEALFLIILLKVGCQGLSFGIYLQTAHPSKKINIIIFSTIYALTSYTVVQSMNVMWMDALILFPLVLLGIERLIDHHRFGLYCICLAATFITNFYIGYMVGIFSAIYAIYYYFSNYAADNFKKMFSAAWRFALFSCIAVMIAAIIILPAYYSLTFGKTGFQDTNYGPSQQFDFLDLFVKMLPSAYDTVQPEGLPIVYCSVLCLIMLPLYFTSKEIPLKKKIGSAILLGVLVVSFNLSTIDIFWHGMSRPNWLNYRYSFIFCAMVILLSYEAFIRLKETRYRKTVAVCAILAFVVMIVQKLHYSFVLDFATIWLSLLMLFVYALALLCQHRDNLGASGRAVIAIILCFELFLSGLYNLQQLDKDVVFSDRSTYRDFVLRFQDMVDTIQEEDTGLFRMEKTIHRKVNDPMALGFKGLSNSTSTLNASVIDFLCNMGYASRSHWSKYLGGTPVSDSLLGIKYVITDSSRNVSRLYQTTEYKNDDIFTVENPYCQAILYAANEKMLTVDFEAYNTPMDRMNALCGAMLGLDEPINLFVPVQPTDTNYENCTVSYVENHISVKSADNGKTSKIVYKIHVPNDNEMYLYFPTSYHRETKILKNGVSLGNYFGNEGRRIMSLGNNHAEQYMYVTMELLEDKEVYYRTECSYFWYLDEKVFADVMEKIGSNPIQITDYDDTHINGTITVTEEKNAIFTSIPYDEGWHVEIDGTPVEITRNLGALLAIDAEQISTGEHTITLRYMPKCVIIGAMVSAGGIVLLAAAWIISSALRRRRARVLKPAAFFPSINLEDDSPDASPFEPAETEFSNTEAPQTAEETNPEDEK